MKNVKTFIKMLPLLLLVAITSCKKDGKSPAPDPAVTQVTNDELLNHYLVITQSTAPRLRILYFSKDGLLNGSGLSATMDNLAGRRIQPVSVTDNSFTFDTDADGKRVYTFKLVKDDAGKITLGAYSFKNKDDGSATLTSADIYKVAEAPDLFSRNLGLVTAEGSSYIKFVADKFTLAEKPDFTGSITQGTFYKIAPGAWKGNLIGINCMGVTIPAIGNTPATMGVEFAGGGGIGAYTPY